MVGSADKESSYPPQEGTTVCQPILSETISQPVVVGSPKDDGDLTNAVGLSEPSNRGALELPAALPALHFTDSISATQVTYFRRNSRIQFVALCWCLFLGGWNDGKLSLSCCDLIINCSMQDLPVLSFRRFNGTITSVLFNRN